MILAPLERFEISSTGDRAFKENRRRKLDGLWTTSWLRQLTPSARLIAIFQILAQSAQVSHQLWMLPELHSTFPAAKKEGEDGMKQIEAQAIMAPIRAPG
jgi:hypothetical protein